MQTKANCAAPYSLLIKNIILWVIGLALITLTACGGASNSNASTIFESDDDIQFKKDGEVTISYGEGDFNCILASGDGLYLLGKYVTGFNDSYAEFFVVNEFGERLTDVIESPDSELIRYVKAYDCKFCKNDDEPEGIAYLGGGMFGIETERDGGTGTPRVLYVYNIENNTQFQIIDESSSLYIDPYTKHSFAGNDISTLFSNGDYALLKLGNTLQVYSKDGYYDTAFESDDIYEEVCSKSGINNGCFFYCIQDYNHKDGQCAERLYYYDISEKQSHLICGDSTALLSPASNYVFDENGKVVIERLGSDGKTWYSTYEKGGTLSEPKRDKKELE